jgi:hypothetical protein
MEIPMSFSRRALLALTGIAALAMPLAVAGSASAATLAGCTITPLAPVLDHTNPSGQKVIRFQTQVSCNGGRSVEIQDDRLEQDLASSDYYGTTVYNINFNSAGTVYRSVLMVLPDADGPLDNIEEMYHSMRFQVTNAAGAVSPWTAWEDSPVVPFPL